MGHPNSKVVRASHSVFIAFMSGKDDIDDEKRTTLKEELVFYYIERSLSVSLPTKAFFLYLLDQVSTR